MEDTKQEIKTDKTEIIEAFQNRKFDDLVEPKKLVDLGKLSRSDYTDIIEAGKRQIETFLSSDLFDIRSAGKIQELLELETEELFPSIGHIWNQGKIAVQGSEETKDPPCWFAQYKGVASPRAAKPISKYPRCAQSVLGAFINVASFGPISAISLSTNWAEEINGTEHSIKIKIIVLKI